MTSFWESATELLRARKSFVVVTLLSSRGHAPQDPGAKCLVTEAGLFSGTVGGGRVEAKAIAHSQALLKSTQSRVDPEVHTWNLQRDVGMTCGGEVTYLFELHRATSWEIVVFGAGHIAQALIPILVSLPCRVICVDSRPEWLDKLRPASNLTKERVDSPENYAPRASAEAYFVVMTRGHSIDMPVVHEIYRHFPSPRYLGVIGSDVKALKIKNELREKNYNPVFVEKLRCPMGLSLGSNHPAEIAVSIAAELIQVRDSWGGSRSSET